MNASILAAAVAAGRSALTESEGKTLLALCGIDVPRSRVVAGAEDAAAAVAGLDGPFVVKVVSSDILHKSNAGGVAIGLAVRPFEGEAKDALLALGLPPGTSVANPVDTPVITLQTHEGRIANAILDIIYRHARPDAVVMHLNLAAFVGRAGVDPVDNLIQAAVGIGRAYPGQAHFALVLRVDGSPELDDAKRRYCGLARDAAIPVFDELHEAARALAAVGHLEGALGRGYRAGSPHGRLDGPAACGHVETTPCLN